MSTPRARLILDALVEHINDTTPEITGSTLPFYKIGATYDNVVQISPIEFGELTDNTTYDYEIVVLWNTKGALDQNTATYTVTAADFTIIAEMSKQALVETSNASLVTPHATMVGQVNEFNDTLDDEGRYCLVVSVTPDLYWEHCQLQILLDGQPDGDLIAYTDGFAVFAPFTTHLKIWSPATIEIIVLNNGTSTEYIVGSISAMRIHSDGSYVNLIDSAQVDQQLGVGETITLYSGTY